MSEEHASPRWRIGQLSKRLGLSPELLRAWEQRYGLLAPERGSGGFRLYSAADEARVRRVLELRATGLATAEAVQIAIGEAAQTDTPAPGSSEPAVPGAAGVLDDLRQALARALEAFDETSVQATLDRAFATVGVDRTVQAVVLPALRDIGTRWEHGRTGIAQEHYATNILQARLMGLARGWDEGGGPRAVLACAPAELHVVGLICLGLALRYRGWRILFLGADTPLPALERIVEDVAPPLVALSAVLPERFLMHEAALRAISARTALGLGGAGATAGVAERVGALAPQPDPVAAADAWGRHARQAR